MSKPWRRIYTKVNDGHGEAGEPDIAVCRRVFGEEGKLWPRMVLVIYAHNEYSGSWRGMRVEHCYKRKADDWWCSDSSCPAIPLELLDDLQEMIAEAKEKIAALPTPQEMQATTETRREEFRIEAEKRQEEWYAKRAEELAAGTKRRDLTLIPDVSAPEQRDHGSHRHDHELQRAQEHVPQAHRASPIAVFDQEPAHGP